MKDLKKQKLQIPKRGNSGFDKETNKWWGFYKRSSPVFLYSIEFMDGTKKVQHGKMYSPIYSDGTVRHFFDHYENGTNADWVSRFNEVFKSDYGSMKEVKMRVSELDGEWGEFVYFYASRYMPEAKSFRIINHPEFPIRRKKGKYKLFQK